MDEPFFKHVAAQMKLKTLQQTPDDIFALYEQGKMLHSQRTCLLKYITTQHAISWLNGRALRFLSRPDDDDSSDEQLQTEFRTQYLMSMMEIAKMPASCESNKEVLKAGGLQPVHLDQVCAGLDRTIRLPCYPALPDVLRAQYHLARMMPYNLASKIVDELNAHMATRGGRLSAAEAYFVMDLINEEVVDKNLLAGIEFVAVKLGYSSAALRPKLFEFAIDKNRKFIGDARPWNKQIFPQQIPKVVLFDLEMNVIKDECIAQKTKEWFQMGSRRRCLC